ncbi:MAG: hypothetical protein M5R36_10030 [Deltaproteobacteria bacterium]|nr:hypothetical protein [Deltaproteobacteria bacterium]
MRVRLFILAAIAALALAPVPALAQSSWCESTATDLEPMPNAVNVATAAEHNGKIYVVSGYDDVTDDWTDTVLEYDIAGDTWDTVTSIPTARTEACNTGMIPALGRFCVIGGNTDGVNFSDDVECYDPVGDDWDALDPLPAELTGVYCAVHNNVIYVTGGYNGATSTALYWYDTAAASPSLADRNQPHRRLHVRLRRGHRGFAGRQGRRAFHAGRRDPSQCHALQHRGHELVERRQRRRDDRLPLRRESRSFQRPPPRRAPVSGFHGDGRDPRLLFRHRRVVHRE